MQVKYKKVYIKEKTGNNTYRVIDCKTHKEIGHPVHVNRLKEFFAGKDAFPDRIVDSKEDEPQNKDDNQDPDDSDGDVEDYDSVENPESNKQTKDVKYRNTDQDATKN